MKNMYFIFLHFWVMFNFVLSFSFSFSLKKNVPNMLRIGYDERYPTNVTFINRTELALFNIHWKQLEILRMLQNNAVSIYSKIHLIDHFDILSSTRSIYSPNLCAGGLMNEWDSD
jgi:hypothetical protein